MDEKSGQGEVKDDPEYSFNALAAGVKSNSAARSRGDSYDNFDFDDMVDERFDKKKKNVAESFKMSRLVQREVVGQRQARDLMR